MGFYDIQSFQRKMRVLREKGEIDPVKFGFNSWNQFDKGRLIMGSRKATMLIGGEPNHGKSAFANELIMQLIENHNFKVAVFTTESGEVEKVFSNFCGLYQGKAYSKIRPDGKINNYAMTEEECSEAEYFLLDKLYVFKQDRKNTKYQTLENIYLELKKAEDLYNIKFDCLVIDPVYDVDDFEPKANEVLRVLNRFNLEAEENNRFDIMVNHVADTHKSYDQKTGKRRKTVALADEFYGGKNNNRKAMLQILVSRPDPCDGEGGEEVVLENQTNIHVLKVKPEGVAKWGIYPIYYDWRRRRYYETYDGEDGYSVTKYSNKTKFENEHPTKSIDISNFRFTPEQAFQTNKTEINGEEDDFPF